MAMTLDPVDDPPKLWLPGEAVWRPEITFTQQEYSDGRVLIRTVYGKDRYTEAMLMPNEKAALLSILRIGKKSIGFELCHVKANVQ